MHPSSKRLVAALCALMAVSWTVPARALGAQEKAGTLTGVVYEAKGGNALTSAGVEVVGTGKTVRTGVDGDYSIELTPGTYQVRFFFDNFNDQTEDVTIAAGETLEKSVALTPLGYSLGEVETVTSGAETDTIAVAMEERKASSSIADIVSREEIKNDTKSTTAGVVQRIVGVTVASNGVANVRGLGDRYSQTVLNQAVMPTPDPERRSVPLDLVPSNLLQSVKVLKTYTPDQPGEFSGGLMRLETVEMPSETSLEVSYSIGFNTQTTGEDFLTYPGDDNDFFGFGLNRRELPANIPPGQLLLPGNPFTPGGFTREQLQEFGRSFENVWTPRAESGRPNNTFNFAGGKRFGKFGVVGAIGLKNELQTQDEFRSFYSVDSTGELIRTTNYDYNVSSNVARLGGTFNVTYDLNGNNKFFFKNFFSNQATDEARIFEGFNEDRGADLRNTRLRYTLERIYTGQFSGRHTLGWLAESIFNWRFTYSRATLDEPDLREALYERAPGASEFTYLDQNQSLFRLFSDMNEDVREPAFDLTKFWFLSGVTINGKIGASYINRDRTFDSRRFRFGPRFLTDLDRTAPPEVLLAPENIRPTNGFEIQETTRATDHYDALQNITAGYGMADITWSRWRFIGGARVERSIQRVNTFTPFTVGVPTSTANLDDTDVLPSVGVVYALTAANTMNIRAGFSRTVTRPQFRELSPFEFTDVTGGRSVVGNPDLTRTLITNYDVRYEWFPGPNDLLAFSYFYKQLDDPIEQIVEPGANLRTSFRNADQAQNQGLEIEFRKDLSFFGEAFQTLSLNTNYTFVDSNVTLTPEQGLVVTSLERSLVGQSRHLFNAILAYEIPRIGIETRGLFNYTGERITDVGTLGLPDIVEKGRPSLDLSFGKHFGGERKPWAVQLELENLLNRQRDIRQGDSAFRVYRAGREISIGVSYNFF
jgi:hypothetical protein